MHKLALILIVLGFAGWWFKDPSITAPASGVTFDYVVEYSGEADPSAALPMLVALHGNGDTPGNFYDTALDNISIRARILLIEAPLSMGTDSAWPGDSAGLRQYGEALSEILPLLMEKYATKGKPALFGFSGGGIMAYYQAVTHPEQYSYIFPISGTLTDNMLADTTRKRSPGLRIFAFHGIQDQVVAINGGRSALRLLEDRDANIQFNAFKGGHHGIFTNAKQEISGLVDEKLKRLLYDL